MSTINEQLAAAIANANATLDWIEERQGTLAPDCFAAIETTVGLVRALRGAVAADTVTVDRASLVAHNLEKWEQIDQLQRAAAASEQRAAALEAQMLEILRWSAWQVRLNDWRQHRVTAVGTRPTPDNACREIRAIARAALAAAAPSAASTAGREEAGGE